MSIALVGILLDLLWYVAFWESSRVLLFGFFRLAGVQLLFGERALLLRFRF